MAKKKKQKRGRREVEDKIVQVRYSIRRSDWEKIAKMPFYSVAGNKLVQAKIREALIKNGIKLKK